MKMEQTECSETSAYKIHTPGNHPEENTAKVWNQVHHISLYNRFPEDEPSSVSEHVEDINN